MQSFFWLDKWSWIVERKEFEIVERNWRDHERARIEGIL